MTKKSMFYVRDLSTEPAQRAEDLRAMFAIDEVAYAQEAGIDENCDGAEFVGNSETCSS